MKILVPVVLALLSANALAEENKPFNTANGRLVRGGGPQAAAPAAAAAGAPGGAAANGPAAAAPSAPGLRAGVTVYGPGQTRRVSSGRGIRGGGGRSTGQSIGFVGARRATGAGAGQPAGGVGPKTVAAAAEEAPPNFSKPGALIRDTGQQPVYEKTTTRTTGPDAGEIVMNDRKAFDVGKAPSLQMGPKDTPPPPNPGTGGSYYGTGAAANGPTTGSSGSSGSSGSGSSGKDNNGSGNNDKGTDSTDGHGNTKKDSTFDDPTGFNAAF